MIFQNLKTKIIASVIFVVVIIQGMILYNNVRELSRMLIDKAEREAGHLSETIKRSLKWAMIKNRRDEVQRIIDSVADQKGIIEVKIFNKMGEITVAADKDKVGKKVDMKAEACYGCHGEGAAKKLLPTSSRTRVFTSVDGTRNLGLILPIYNKPECYSCHPKEQNVLGVLDTVLSLDDTDRSIATSKWGMCLSALISFIAISLILSLLLSKLVSRPISRLFEATREATNAHGHLSHKVKATSKDEIGMLTESFNVMMEEVRKSKKDIEEWSRTLEERVQEKTLRLRAMQDQLIQAGKMVAVGKLAAGVAHEINNPLTNILTSGEYLQKKSPENYPFTEDLDIIVNESLRCRKIVKGLLDFARQTRPEKKLSEINQIIQAVLVLVENQAAFHNIKIVSELDPSIPKIMVDSDQIQQVFTNMVLNAAEAMKGGGVLRIKTALSQDGSFLEVTFSDTGCGIPKEHIDRIFDPFFTTKDVGTGTGLGLSVSYGIVEKHGGSIDVESKVKEGTTFVIHLPLVTTRSEETASADVRPA
jgi:two-component system NtrC family sensor kinase